MHIKRFEAASMEEALEQVRSALGPDALILSSRTLPRGRGISGMFARPMVEVQAAVERGPRAPAAAVPDRSDDAPSSQTWPAHRHQERFEQELRSELAGLRAAFRSLADAVAPEAADRTAERLRRAGLERIHARRLSIGWQAEQEDGKVRSLEDFMRDRIDARLAVPRFDRSRRIRVLVGAPGAGKTTTLAKLAARSEEGERDVSFVSLDPYRIGAREQLERYAALLESPYRAIARPAEVAEVARQHPDHEILVDTAGRSPVDHGRQLPLDEVREVFGERASIEVVVDATARPEVARAQLARFASLAPDRLILTRLDECDSLAPVLNLLLDEACPPLCWLGTGQRVPEDLEIAEPERFLAELLGRAA